jgi:hypothetical protein
MDQHCKKNSANDTRGFNGSPQSNGGIPHQKFYQGDFQANGPKSPHNGTGNILKSQYQTESSNHSKSVINRKNNNSVFAQNKISQNLMRGIRAGGPNDAK